MEESQAMTDASKIMLTRLMAGGGVKVGFGSSLLEEAKAAARGEPLRVGRSCICQT